MRRPVRSSRHIFQQTHSSSRPPAISRPITEFQQLDREQSEDDAEQRRGRDAEHHYAPALLQGEPSDRDADDDGVIPGQDEVDQDHLDERRKLGHRNEIHTEVLSQSTGSPVCPEAHANSRV